MSAGNGKYQQLHYHGNFFFFIKLQFTALLWSYWKKWVKIVTSLHVATNSTNKTCITSFSLKNASKCFLLHFFSETCLKVWSGSVMIQHIMHQIYFYQMWKEHPGIELLSVAFVGELKASICWWTETSQDWTEIFLHNCGSGDSI